MSETTQTVMLTVSIKTVEDGRLVRTRSETIESHHDGGVLVDAAVQDLAARIARYIRVTESQTPVRSPAQDHSRQEDAS